MCESVRGVGSSLFDDQNKYSYLGDGSMDFDSLCFGALFVSRA